MKIPIVSAHIYSLDTKIALAQVQSLYDDFPDRRIWITELTLASNANQGCGLDTDGVIDWMRRLLPQIVGLGYVDKIFWNTENR